MTSQRVQLTSQTDKFRTWLFDFALPLWWQAGADQNEGGFYELLSANGTPPESFRRARVQARQSYVYAQAGLLGWNGPWAAAATHGLAYLTKRYRNGDNQYATLVSARGEILNPTSMLYDQAFALMASAWVVKALPERKELKTAAHDLFDKIIATRRHPAGGFVESGDKQFISNPHMHLLEALLAWCEVEPEVALWGDYADHIADLARTKFIDAEGGFLREFFDEHWNPAPGSDGHVVEPGHQFEWAWLLMRWGQIRHRPEIRAVALKLFEHGVRGIDPKRDAAIHAMNDRFEIVVPTARLWAQTERIKAALSLAEQADDYFVSEALKGADCLWRYFETETKGLWYDRFEPNGSFVPEPAPASTFYHIICCIACMVEATNKL